MPGANYIVFKNMRPPVAIDYNGVTPVRTKSAKRTFSLGNGNYQDKNGFKISKEAIVKNQTDDGRLSDVNWNQRHHVTPSNFNNQNHSYYRVSSLMIDCL